MTDHPRLFADWRFMVSLAFLLMVGYLVLTGVSAMQQNADKDRRDAIRSAQINDLIAAGQRSNEAASRERQALLNRLSAYDARQRALLAYLRAHGVEIPTRFIEAPVTPGGVSSVTRSPSAPQKPSSGPIFNQPPPSIAAPGNSGEHRHGPKKPHK